MELKITVKDGEKSRTLKMVGNPLEWVNSLVHHVQSFTKLMYDDKSDEQT